MWILSYLIKTIKRSVKNNDTSYAIVVPLLKGIFLPEFNLFRNHIPVPLLIFGFLSFVIDRATEES